MIASGTRARWEVIQSMRVATYEATFEQGKIRLEPSIVLPENTRVYVVVPGIEVVEVGHIFSPRLAYPEQAADVPQ
jgi:hypothetical protein